MTINSMINSVARCVKCGASMREGCACWVKLKCPECGKTRMVDRDKTDPPETAEVQCTCDECDRGDFSECIYFDADGKQLDAL